MFMEEQQHMLMTISFQTVSSSSSKSTQLNVNLTSHFCCKQGTVGMIRQCHLIVLVWHWDIFMYSFGWPNMFTYILKVQF